MATWKISRETIELFPHTDPTVERLELGKLGQYQVVTQKGLYKNGQIVIFVPEKSLLPDSIADVGDTRKYLAGPLKNRVKSIKLRHEISQGMILEDKTEFADIPIGEDISEKMGITQYEPPIPVNLAGEVDNMRNFDFEGKTFRHHDVEQFGINRQEFTDGEQVIVCEKCHGSQLILTKTAKNEFVITSKGLANRDLCLKESDTNLYWQAVKNTGLQEMLTRLYPNDFVQVFAEAVPCQKGFNYGQSKPILFIFRVEVNNKWLNIDDIPEELKKMWVPILYQGPFDLAKILPLREGMESVSGKGKHIKEGVVLSTHPHRMSQFSKQRFPLFVKLLNPSYKESGEEFN